MTFPLRGSTSMRGIKGRIVDANAMVGRTGTVDGVPDFGQWEWFDTSGASSTVISDTSQKFDF